MRARPPGSSDASPASQPRVPPAPPRLWRPIAALVIATILLAALVCVTHYHVNRTVPMNLLRRFARHVQPELDRLGSLPDLGPSIIGEWAGRVTSLTDEALRRYTATTDEQVIVAVGRPHSPLLQRGRPVVVLSDGRLRVIWLSETEYHARLAAQNQRVDSVAPP